MALPDGAAQVFADVTRISTLDPSGYPAIGSATYTTDSLVKVTFAPAVETGDDLVMKNAAGNIQWHYKHGDMPKYFTVTLEMATPDETMEHLLIGGVLYSDSSVALVAPAAAPTAAASPTGGSLASGSYVYELTSVNQYGESLPSAASTAAVVTSPTSVGSVALSGIAPGTGSVWTRIYGRVSGALQLLATIPATTTTWTDTGAIIPFGAVPTVNTTAGPGSAVGMAPPNLGIVGNPYGVSLEFWGKAVTKGQQVAYLPYYRWVLPGCKNFRNDSREFTNVGLANIYIGEAFENANWGSGPFGDWQFASTQVWQRARAGSASLPAVGLSSVPATA
jgi:hypothetical protein